jgi:hypothetical protein
MRRNTLFVDWAITVLFNFRTISSLLSSHTLANSRLQVLRHQTHLLLSPKYGKLVQLVTPHGKPLT